MILLLRALIAVILVTILIGFFYSKGRRFGFWNRIIIGILSAALIAIIVIYEISDTKRSTLNRELLNAFNQNQTLICGEREVRVGEFDFVGGTKVFSGRKEKIIVPIESCKVK
ncbi:MAG: hypothetical protein LBQ18_03420 [Campylobacteraceae bacterium]|jgi:hypothetical protein|nr:hypothetical protein [Campylobacteraceae bacterium]